MNEAGIDLLLIDKVNCKSKSTFRNKKKYL